MSPSRIGASVLALGIVASTIPACGADPATTIDVFAASSLAAAFGELEGAFEAEHEGVDVVVQFAGSQVLATQIVEGAPVDLFVSADARHVERVRAAGRLTSSSPLASNRLVIGSVGPQIRSASDLADPRLRVVLAHESVPAGQATRAALDRLGLWEAIHGNVRSFEPDARRVLTKLELGEADAVIVYASDAGDPRFHFSALDPERTVDVHYTAALIVDAQPAALVDGFAQFIRSPAGQSILTRHGFSALDDVAASTPSPPSERLPR